MMLSGLANHLWQSTVFAVVAGSLTLLLQANHARTRHWLWLAASLKFLIPFSLLVGIGGHMEWLAIPRPPQPAIPAVLEQIGQPFLGAASHASAPAIAPTPGTLVPTLILALWLCGSAGVIGAWTARWRRTGAAMRRAHPMHLPTPIRVMSSPSLFEPGVFGILRPVLLLPEGIADRLTPAQLQAVIAHELCHVRRRDNLAALVHMLVEAAFWFHPLVWWIGARLVNERERACDEEVLGQGSEPRIYAESILKVCEFYLKLPMECLSGITGADLDRRIERIMTHRGGARLNLGRKLLLAVLGTAAVLVPLIVGLVNAPPTQAQSPAAAPAGPQFEVASVKLVKHPVPVHPYMLDVKHGTVTIDAVPLRLIISVAYRTSQVRGGPGWLDDDRYDILAKTGNPNITRDEVRPMLQGLLADRFKLAFHRETRQLPVYTLEVGKNGPKLQAAKDDERGGVNSSEESGRLHLSFQKWPMASLATSLSGLLGNPVVDKTGLTGTYDIKLDFMRDSARPAAGAEPAAGDGGPSLFTALDEQLGLKLEERKGPVEVMVIDHVEHASEN